MKKGPSTHGRLLPPAVAKLTGWAYLFAALTLLISLLVLIGWQFGIRRFQSPIRGLVAMNPLTAICFLLSALSFFLQSAFVTHRGWSRLGKGLAALLIVVCILKITEPWTGSSFHVDQLFFKSEINHMQGVRVSNNMAINTALGFIFGGLGLFLLRYRLPRRFPVVHFFALASGFIGFFTLLGYIFGPKEFYDLLHYQPMALHTAASFVFMSAALLLRNPESGITYQFFSKLTGGLMGRSMLPLIVGIPIVLGMILLYNWKTGFYSTELATTILVFSIVIVFSGLVTLNVYLLNKRDRQRLIVEEELRESEERFRSLVTSVSDYAIFILDPAGSVISWNKGAERIKQYTEQEIIGKHFSVFYTVEDREGHLPEKLLLQARDKGRVEIEGWRVRKGGSVFWANVVITAIYDKDHKLIQFAKVVRDMTERKKAQDMLSRFNDELSRQVQIKTRQIEETSKQLRQLSAHLQTAREEERKSIAFEIHDELGQMLTGLKLDMLWLRKNRLAGEQLYDEKFHRAVDLLNETKNTMRRISSNLRPAILDDLGLEAAMELLSQNFTERSGIPVIYTPTLKETEDQLLTPDMKIGLYRVFQESLNNIARHARAKKVNAFLKTDDSGNIVLGISDDGIGFDKSGAGEKKTLGLISIRERAMMMNGRHEIHSIPGEGTTIIVKVPLNNSSDGQNSHSR